MHDWAALAADIKRWAVELGFQQAGISEGTLARDEAHLERWLAAGHHGEMHWMAAHGRKRSRPGELVPGT
ncbi:MAG: tRNA epoxyqueuosine(34) reductase QueG, partial [Silanimonas lenta]